MAVAWAILDKVRDGATVIVTRANVKRSFAREIAKYSDATVQVLNGQTPAQLEERDFYILSYEILPFWIDALQEVRPESVVFDESHKAKSSKRRIRAWDDDGNPFWADAENIASSAKKLSMACARRLALTATPVANRRSDLYAQLDLVHPNRFGNYFSFTKRYCAGQQGEFGGWQANGKTNTEELKRRVNPLRHVVQYSEVRRMLPPLRRSIVRLDEAELLKRAGDAVPAELNRDPRRRSIERELMRTAGRKHPYVLDVLLEEVIPGSQKAVVFTGRRKDCDTLAARVAEKVARLDTPVALFVGHGGIPVAQRDQMQQDYMAAKGPAILIGTGYAWGTGVNLHDTDLALITMLPYTPEALEQWEGRFVRQGMTRPCLIQYLIAEKTVDTWVEQLLLSKLPDVDELVANGAIDGLGDALAAVDEEAMLSRLYAAITGAGLEEAH